MAETNTKDIKEIYIGHKPSGTYVLVSLSALKHRDTVTIRARGREISKAATVAELLKKQGVHSTVETYTDDIEVKDDKGNVVLKPITAIEIRLSKKL